MITDEYGIAERQKELLEIIKDVDFFMTESEIRYSLGGGTLLGAIRHGGFIPWDDDVDLILDRKNFNKLVSVFNDNCNVIAIKRPGGVSKEYVFSRRLWVYRICLKEERRDERRSQATIDIFTLDPSPDSTTIRKLKTLGVKILQGMMKERLNLKGQSMFYKLCLIGSFTLGRFIPDKVKFSAYDFVSQIGARGKSSALTAYNDLFKLLETRYPKDLMEVIERRPFEDAFLPTVAKYDSYLTAQYGDYMTLPPHEMRRPQHMENEL